MKSDSSILRVVIIIVTSWALLYGLKHTYFYCGITLQGVKSGFVFARTPEEFIEKTDLPVSTTQGCPVLYDKQVEEYVVKTGRESTMVLTLPHTSTDTILSLANIHLNPLDKIHRDGNTIIVKKGWIEKKTKLIPLAPLIWKQTVIYDSNLPPGRVERVHKASGGLKKIVEYRYILEGTVVKEWREEKVIIKPTGWVFRSGPPTYTGPYKKKFIALITAYSPEDPGVDWVTATGDRARKGVVAVDPRLVPLHSKLYIEGYGASDAVDVGGWIKYYHIDVFFPTKEEALKWGKRYKWVYIIKYPEGK